MNRRHFLGSTLSAVVAAAVSGTAQANALLRSLTVVTSSIVGRSGDGNEVTIEKAALKELKDALRGRLLLAGNDGYDAARRVLNPSINRHPALIVQPSGAADVATAVTFAHERGLLVAVKCGGHSFSGKSTCDGGIQIDLSMMRGARVDRENRRAHVAVNWSLDAWPELLEERLFQFTEFPVCSPKLLEHGARLEKPEDLLKFPLLHNESIAW